MVKLTKAEEKRRTICVVDVQIEEGARLGDLVDKYGPDCKIDVDYGYYDDPDTYHLRYYRLETDEEYEARLEDLRELKRAAEREKAERRKLREEEERATYERLKKKFG